MSQCLVAYFSASGVTAQLANTIAKVTKSDLYEIVPKIQYTSKDLNWNDKKSRSSIEMNDKKARPEIASPLETIAPYDIVFVGFPIWWYEAPRIIQTFLENYDFSGKTVIPFATSGGSDMGNTSTILQKSCPHAKVLSGKRFRGSASQAEISDWITSLGI